MMRVVTPPTGAPLLSLEDLKSHLREDQDHAGNDARIAALGAVAVAMIETETQRAYAERTLEWVLPCFRPAIRLPLAPVLAVEAVRYTDAAGAVQTLDRTAYVLEPDGETRRLVPRWGTSWPCVGQGEEPVTIRFRVGGRPLPPTVAQAALLIVGHLYDNREAVVANASNMGELPMGVEALISAERWA